MSQMSTSPSEVIGQDFGDDIRREMGEHVLLSPARVAEVLEVQEDTLAKWRCQGGGPQDVRIGKRVSYLEADIVAFITARRKNGGTNNKAA